MTKVEELAKMIDHSILHPTFTDVDLIRECEIAKQYNVASVCVKPFHVIQAAELLKGSTVLVGCVIGFPAGNSSTKVKAFEAAQACKEGAVEIDMVVNIGKVLQEDWNYIEQEIKAIVDTAHIYNAITKVIFETDYITNDLYKIKLCEICTRVKAEYVKTSTGFGFVKGADGKFSYTGANEHDIALMKKYSGANVKIKASGGIRSLSELLKYKELGISRCGATATVAILEEAKKRFA